MVGGIVGEGECFDVLSVDPDDDLGGIGILVGLRIAVWKSAGVGDALTAHEVTLAGCAFAILAVEALGRGLEEERGTPEVLDLDVIGYHDLVLEVTAAETVDLFAAHGVGGLFRPFGLGEAMRCKGPDGEAGSFGCLGSVLDTEEDEVAMEGIAKLVAQDEAHDIEAVSTRSGQDGGVDGLVGVGLEGNGVEEEDFLFDGFAKVVPSGEGGFEHQVAWVDIGHDGEITTDDDLALRLHVLDERTTWGDVVGRMEVAHRHTGDEGVETIDLGAAIVAHVSVPFVDNVVVLGVEPAGALGMGTEGIDHQMIVPRDIDVACGTIVAPDIAAFAVEHGDTRLMTVASVVPDGAFVGPTAVFVELRFPSGAGEVAMPGVEVGDEVVEVTGRVVLDKTGWVELLGELIHLFHPVLRGPVVATQSVGLAGGEESPCLVEVDPGEDGRVVEVATKLPAHTTFPVLAPKRVVVGPPVWSVLHDEEAKAVCPVELAGNFRLDVDAVAGKAELLGNLYVATHVVVGGIGVEALWVVALVEGELEVDGMTVEGDVGELGAGERVHADGTLTEVGLDNVEGRTFAGDGHFNLVEIGVVEVP